LALVGATGPAQSIVPSWNAPPGASTRNDVAQISSRMRHSAARFVDGSVAMWGDNTWGQCNVPALPPGTRYLQVSTGSRHTLALRSDGATIGWGDNAVGECAAPALPPGVVFTGIEACTAWSLGLRSDGQLAVWGNPGTLQTVPAGNDFVAISAGDFHNLALQ
jgi:alpha-tubulin suppressor-like RCC1 family protein